MESHILFRVKHLQQCRCRVAVVGLLRHFVNLVENEHGVAAASLLDVLDDLTCHCPYVRAAVSADFSLVV